MTYIKCHEHDKKIESLKNEHDTLKKRIDDIEKKSDKENDGEK
jgi:hypothetical protein